MCTRVFSFQYQQPHELGAFFLNISLKIGNDLIKKNNNKELLLNHENFGQQMSTTKRKKKGCKLYECHKRYQLWISTIPEDGLTFNPICFVQIIPTFKKIYYIITSNLLDDSGTNGD